MKNITRKYLLPVFLLLSVYKCAAQDTTQCYTGYMDDLIVSLYQSILRTFEVDISQKITSDTKSVSSMQYLADADIVSGIELDYDKFGIGFGYKSKPPDDIRRKGTTDYTVLGLNIGGNKWIVETSYRKYRGFYDANTVHYDSTFTDTTPYFQNRNLTNSGFKAKFLYFFNHDRFSFKSSYGCTYRQLRTKFSWIFMSNLYHYQMFSDSSFIPRQLQSFYGNYSDWNRLNSTGFSLAGGFSGNIVIFKTIFANLTFDIGPELQHRYYGHLSGSDASRTYVAYAGDFRAALGINGKRFFTMLTSSNDFTSYKSGQLEISNKYLSFAFQIGYRFRVKTPGFYKKFQETKVYSWF